MKVFIYPDEDSACRKVAAMIADAVRSHPDLTLGLATGGTMEPVYALLGAACRAGEVSFAKARSFNLDEYVGLGADNPESYWYYMHHHFFDHVDFTPGSERLPRGDANDPDQEARQYEADIAAAGNVHFQLLGIGPNGHIGFNEPSSSLSSLTRVVALSDSTIEANSRYFDNPDDVPRLAITMGIGTILRSHEVVLLATGAKKADCVAQMIEGPLSVSCPASALQMHKSATIVLDEEAAANLAMHDYYRSAYPID